MNNEKLNVHLKRVERIYREKCHMANGRSLFAPAHEADADALGTLLELVRSNEHALHECRACGALFFGTARKQYCSGKCRQTGFRKF